MLTAAELRQLIHLELPEPEALAQLAWLTPEQITPALFAEALQTIRETGVSIDLPNQSVMDCCGTGGSGLPHFNTSTTVAFILASAGVPVVKFGNRGFSSQSGSFDLLEQLGFSERVDLQRLPEALEQSGLIFLFAPQCYPQLARFNQLRRTLKTRTLFNFLGPLLNPVQPAYRLLGVSNALMQKQMADYLAQSSTCQRAWVVRGQTGLDELETHHPTDVFSLEGQQSSQSVLPPFYGERLDPAESLEVPNHSPQDNLKIFMGLLQNEDCSSVNHNMVCLNAGAGLLIAGKARTLAEGVQEASNLLKSGAVLQQLERCRRVYETFAIR